MSDPLQMPEASGHRTSSKLVALAAVAAVLGGLGLTALWILRADEPRPPFLDGTAAAASAASAPRQGVLQLAGSGSNLPLTRALTAAYAEQGGARPFVHASIGSTGGLRALRDGVIDVALVSRPLAEDERAQGFVATPYAKVPVVVAVHVDVPITRLSSRELLDIYAGRRTTWPDGSPIVVLQRERGDSSHFAVEQVWPEFATINAEAYARGEHRVLYHDAAMVEVLSSTAGAIGLHGSGIIPNSHAFRAVELDGVAPSPENVASGRYPVTKVLSFVTVGPPGKEAAAFVAFTRSPEAQRVILEHGAVPVSEGQP